jgi:hypothetical protein
MDLGWVTELARSATQILHEASGATSIHDAVPMQRIWRDIQLYGRVLCGLEPNTTLL